MLDAAWDLSSSRGVEQLLGGVTLREVAAAAGVTPSAVSYHFPSMRVLTLGMVEHFVETRLAPMWPPAVDAVEIVMEPAGQEALAQLIRAAADVNMAVLLSDEELEDEWKLLRCRAAVGTGGGETGATLIGELEGTWIRELARIYQLAAERSGCRLMAPLTYEELALAGSALSLGLQHAWACRPHAVRPDLLGDILTAMCSAVLVPASRPGAMQELDASLPFPAMDAHMGSAELLAKAAPVAHLFSTGVDAPTMAEVGAALGCTPMELVHHYGSMRRLAAMAFARHLPTIESAALRRPDAAADLRLADGLHALARCVWTDRGCARALLLERLEEGAVGEASGEGVRIRDLVPLSAALRGSLAELIGGEGRECEDLVEVMVDLVLDYGVTHQQMALSKLTDLAMRLVPRAGGEP